MFIEKVITHFNEKHLIFLIEKNEWAEHKYEKKRINN